MNSSDLFEAKKELKTLYVSRKLINGEDLVAWAHEQGFDKCLDPKEMHVTVAYSKKKIDQSEMTDSFDTVRSGKKGKNDNNREMKLFGEKEDCVVLVFECPELHERWEEFIDDFGASWDHDGYHPHVTISYAGMPEDMKLEDIKPYKGVLEFGPEIHKEVNPKWKGKVKEKKTKPKIDESKKSGTATDARARKLMADVTRFARSNGVAIRFRHPFRHAESEIEVTDLNAHTPGGGNGTKVMQYLGQAADAEQMNIYVQPGDRRNAEFYARFGFERSPYGTMVRYPEMDDDDREEVEAMRQKAMDRGLIESKGARKLEATPENIERAKEFVLRKWRERATERGYPEPEDLSSSCKFTSMFAQAIFGGQIRGNYEHQFLVIDDEIIDLNKDAADVKAMDDPHDHDESWFGNDEHIDSMQSCKPRVMDWVREFKAGLNESFTLNSLDDDQTDRLVSTFQKSYEAQTGSSWAEDKLLSRARNWTFYGDENGYLAVRVQASGMKKMVAVAGDPKSILKGMAELQAEGGPIWGAVSGELAAVAKKRGMIVPHLFPGGALLIKTLAKSIPASVFGGVEPKVTDNGGIVLDYDDTGSATKYFVGNKEYFQSALKLPMVASQVSNLPGLKPLLKLMGLNETIEISKLYHGTSTGQFTKLREAEYEAKDFSLSEASVEQDALMAAAKDGTDPLIMEIDANKLTGALALCESEGGGFLYNGSLDEAVIRYYPFEGTEPLSLSESVATNWPTLHFEELYHVGTMDAAQKRTGSLEGSGLSVSRHPESWMQIARGDVNGDIWKLTKPGNAFLHFHALKPEQRQVLTNWGIQHRFVTGGESFVLPYYNEDMEEDSEMEFDSMEDAVEEAEYLGLDASTIRHDKSVLKATPKLLSVTNKGNGLALQLLATVYVEAMLPFDGVWWADEFDPDRLSAPRGVICRNKVSEWTAEKDPHAQDADDGDFD